MNGQTRLVSLLGVALVVAAFLRTRSKGEFALGLVSLMLVGVVYLDQTRRLDGDAPSLAEPAARPGPAEADPGLVGPTMPDVVLLNVTSGEEAYASLHGAATQEGAEAQEGSMAQEKPEAQEEPEAQHPKEVLEQRQLQLQDYMMQPSVTRKPTASVLNSYIESLARQHRAENSRDPSLRRR